MKWNGENSVEIRHDQEAAKKDKCSCGGTLGDVDFCKDTGYEVDCEDCGNFGVLSACEGILVKKICRACGAKYETD